MSSRALTAEPHEDIRDVCTSLTPEEGTCGAEQEGQREPNETHRTMDMIRSSISSPIMLDVPNSSSPPVEEVEAALAEIECEAWVPIESYR